MTEYILSLAKKMVRLDISEPHSVLLCVEDKFSLIEYSGTPVRGSTIE